MICEEDIICERLEDETQKRIIRQWIILWPIKKFCRYIIPLHTPTRIHLSKANNALI